MIKPVLCICDITAIIYLNMNKQCQNSYLFCLHITRIFLSTGKQFF